MNENYNNSSQVGYKLELIAFSYAPYWLFLLPSIHSNSYYHCLIRKSFKFEKDANFPI